MRHPVFQGLNGPAAPTCALHNFSQVLLFVGEPLGNLEHDPPRSFANAPALWDAFIKTCSDSSDLSGAASHSHLDFSHSLFAFSQTL